MKYSIFFLSLLLCISCVSCQKTPASNGASSQQESQTDAFIQQAITEAQAESVGEASSELHVMWWGEKQREEKTQAAIQIFSKKYPNIHITTENHPWNEYWDHLAVLQASGDLPDVMQQDSKYLTLYDSKGLLMDLSPYLEKGLIDLSDCEPIYWQPGISDQKLLGICLGINTSMTLINAELLKKADLDMPIDSWTYGDYLAILDGLALKSKELGIDYPDQSSWDSLYEVVVSRFEEERTSFFDPNGLNAFGWNKEQGKRIILSYALTEKANIAAKRCVPLADRKAVLENGISSGPITQQKAVMSSGFWSNQAGELAGDNSQNMQLIAMPNLTQNKIQSLRASQFFSISTTTDAPDQAALFISEFINNIEMNHALAGERGVPIAEKVRNELGKNFNQDSLDYQIYDYIGRIQKISGPIPNPEPPSYAVIRGYLDELFIQIIEQDADPEEAFDTFYNQSIAEFDRFNTSK